MERVEGHETGRAGQPEKDSCRSIDQVEPDLLARCCSKGPMIDACRSGNVPDFHLVEIQSEIVGCGIPTRDRVVSDRAEMFGGGQNLDAVHAVGRQKHAVESYDTAFAEQGIAGFSHNRSVAAQQADMHPAEMRRNRARRCTTTGIDPYGDIAAGTSEEAPLVRLVNGVNLAGD